MSFWDDLTGKTAADASKAAATDTYGKQTSAIQNLLNYGDQAKAGYDQIGQSYQPYVNAGNRLAGNSSDALNNLIQDPGSVRSLPGYQFDQGQGIQAIDRSAAARGMDQSGRTLKDLNRFGTGLADQTYGNQLQRLMGINQQGFGPGMAATGAQNSAYGTGIQDQLGARTTAYGGQMGSAGTIGQGDIAAANARASGSQNLLNTGVKIAGMAVGAATGNPMMAMGGGGGGAANSGAAGGGYYGTGGQVYPGPGYYPR